MKNSHPALQKDSISEIRVQKAIDRLHKWMEKRYPVMASLTRSEMIIECLIEVSEERRFIAQQ